MPLPGGPELLVIMCVLLLLFGASRLPKLARSMGQAGKEFKTGLKDGYAEADDACGSCGVTRAEGQKFCPSCGTKA
jgi:sec-independent protein translocase protein TatA